MIADISVEKCPKVQLINLAISTGKFAGVAKDGTPPITLNVSI